MTCGYNIKTACILTLTDWHHSLQVPHYNPDVCFFLKWGQGIHVKNYFFVNQNHSTPVVNRA